MLYSDLFQRLQDWGENSGAEYLANIPGFIENGEARCYRDIDFDVLRTVGTLNLVNGTPTVSAPGDFYLARYLTLIDVSGNRTPLLPKDASFINEFWPISATTGQPLFYAMQDEATFVFAPTPPNGYTVELGYTNRPAAISDGNPSTWLSTHCADLLFYACMVEAATFMKQTPQAAAADQTATYYETRYQQAKQAAMTEEQRKRGDEYRNGEPR